MVRKCPLCKGNLHGSPRGLACSSCGAEGLQFKCGSIAVVRMFGEPNGPSMRYKVAAHGPNADAAAQHMDTAMQQAMKDRPRG